jgi:hypothetical protein
MTVHQMLCHLDDSYLTAFGEKPVSPAGGLMRGPLVKFVALYVPAPWPKGVPTRPEVEQGIGGTPPADFERDRQRLLETFARFCRSEGALAPRHAIFGSMKAADWMRWGFLHADHHLRQFGV